MARRFTPAGFYCSFIQLLDRQPRATWKGQVDTMPYGSNWIAAGLVFLFFAHCAYQSFKEWQAERRADRVETE